MTEDASDHAQRLILELQHRLKNLAAVIRTIARKTIASSQDLQDFQGRFEGRLSALVRAHSAMSRTTENGVDLEEIVTDALIDAAPGTSNWSVSGPRLRLQPALTETMALVFHELALEAAVAGVLSDQVGALHVSWSVTPGNPDALELNWREEGRSERTAPTDFAFANELLQSALPYQFGIRSTLEAHTSGLSWRLVGPLPPVRS